MVNTPMQTMKLKQQNIYLKSIVKCTTHNFTAIFQTKILNVFYSKIELFALYSNLMEVLHNIIPLRTL